MNYRYQWQIIASRVRGLMQAAELHARFLSVRSSDSYGRTARLREEGERIIAEVSDFGDRFQKALPREVTARIEEFEKKAIPLFQKKTDGTPDSREELVWAGLVTLSAFEPEISFLLADVQQAIRSRSELAFAHLQRSIVVDEEFRKKWQAAFSSGEVQCEALGAVHLLSHGIWAFKVSAEGERTDLVYQEAAARFEREQSNAEGLVLTEWKKATSKSQAEAKFKEARDQAHRYGRGVLAGNELTSYRFAIVVSEEQVPIPDDITLEGIVYRHINIAVKPKPPSKS
ncbi:hypothetical protein [Bradyrhizobium sp. CCGUVB23]|uniref:hypothetical protein n=1 Tax=Bradyrhizobium sp. CCGUVB23 TaxID=2949630 RepID=UPI0020B1D407|nr:hypothetical protein [Bradyrhizobium sp. CCGUVB23]MCP3461116.1 hypothetical protein [Bradyrhizobium sp. CCGUVB23]